MKLPIIHGNNELLFRKSVSQVCLGGFSSGESNEESLVLTAECHKLLKNYKYLRVTI